jgi:signal transduction histidine kinase
MDFVANVSHELRTPLTGIVSAGQNIADGLIDDPEKLTLYGRAIVREAHQLFDLVEQILQFSAIQKDRDRYHFEPVDIAQVIEFSLKNTSTLIQQASFQVEQDIETELPPVMADFKALSRCLQNLLSNAVKYGGGAHWVGVRAGRSNMAGKNEIYISIADKGMGIRRDELNYIFEPFGRAGEVTAAQIEGTGLGLPLAKRIAEAMGGRLSVESEHGKGSIFTIRLPIK